ncbi:15-hydroxyprostaglandin dehydrogenase [Trichonephila clavata]|uniref:15-hydroxyprostaglandin dehydrogenase [NAD(+)] n=1 Tax=Trichonephila clavata TaxID=2740835 RepID=A0A8X6LJW1_TRICU|nr:15-hydroxyprostaglandin dehydrogenase [Trichonephila clavata]
MCRPDTKCESARFYWKTQSESVMGAQGLGAAICIELLKQGYKVCVADIQEYKGKHFVHQQEEEFGSENVIFSACDVTKESDYIRWTF